MSDQKEAVTSGCRAILDWMQDRFPEATILDLGQYAQTQRYRWTIVFGPDKAGFRLAATANVLVWPSILKQRLLELEEGTWLSNADVQDKWVVLNAVGITTALPDEW